MVGLRLDDELPQETTLDLDCKIAETREERVAAFRLVYRAYVLAGLSEPIAAGMRVTPYHLQDSTQVFIAASQGEVISTMSLVGDGPLGLPLERVYPDEVQAHRARGRRLAEISCLADRRDSVLSFLPVFLRLSGLCAQFARKCGYDDVLVATHPRHARLYRRLFGFQPVGGLRHYASVRNRPAVALSVNFGRLEHEQPAVHRLLFGTKFPDKVLSAGRMPHWQKHYFRQALTGSAASPSWAAATRNRSPSEIFSAETSCSSLCEAIG